MRKIACLRVSSLLLAVAMCAHALAGDVERFVPPSALGYMVGRDLQAISGKIEQLAKPLGYSIVSPLELAKLTIGLNAGLDTSGSLAIALLPDASSAEEMQPFVLLPVSNYASFAESIQADPSGEICRISLVGEDVLVAKLADYAVLANVENHAAIQRQLDRQIDPELDRTSDPMAQLGPTASWTAKQDLYLVLLPAGLRRLGEWKETEEKQYIFSEEEMQQSMMLSSSLAATLGPELRTWIANNSKLLAIGINADEETNVRLSTELVLNRSSDLAGLNPNWADESQALLGFHAGPFVLNAGGELPSEGGRMLADLLLQLDRNAAVEKGLEGLSTQLWEKSQAANRLLMEPVQSCSLVMLPGEKGEPLVGNLFGIATIADVPKYLESLGQVVETWNEITDASTSDIKPKAELVTRKIAGRPASEILIDYATTMRDDKVPALNWMLESAFGPEGKLQLKFVQVDEKHCLIGLATDEQITAALETLENGTSKLPQTDAAQQTHALLNPNAPWQALVQPQGCLQWVARVENEFLGMAMLSTQEVEYPKMPDSPPVGISLDYQDERWQIDFACPATTWEVLGQYVLNYNELE